MWNFCIANRVEGIHKFCAFCNSTMKSNSKKLFTKTIRTIYPCPTTYSTTEEPHLSRPRLSWHWNDERFSSWQLHLVINLTHFLPKWSCQEESHLVPDKSLHIFTLLSPSSALLHMHRGCGQKYCGSDNNRRKSLATTEGLKKAELLLEQPTHKNCCQKTFQRTDAV